MGWGGSVASFPGPARSSLTVRNSLRDLVGNEQEREDEYYGVEGEIGSCGQAQRR